MKTFFITILAFAFFNICNSQTLQLSNKANPEKVKLFTTFDFLEIQLKDLDTDENILNTATYTGYFETINSYSISFDNDYEYTENTVYDPYSSVVTSRELYSDTFEIKNIDFSDIEYIIHHKNSEKIFQTIATTFLYASIIAPVFSIDYKNLEISSENYFIIAGGSLSTSLISYGLSKAFGRKKFSFISKDNKKEKFLWEISQK
ncbi:MAG: hypothetical protein ABIJ97_12590 [Bacteroidota bacterium]